jgi:pyrophosphatase PpaX
MDILGISEHVDVLVAMEDTERHKPDPTPLLLALDRMGRGWGGAVYVGDAVVDVLAGKAAGMDTVAVTWGAGLPDALYGVRPTAVVATAGELRTAFLG